MISAVTLRAPAKLNLWLKLTGKKRPDGRHEIKSHFAPLALADTLKLENASRLSLAVSGPFAAGVPSDQRNLVWRAYHEFCQTFGAQPAMHMILHKHIPHSAGLGGGSANAGALLTYLARRADVPLHHLRNWSVCLGADIPAAIGSHSGYVEGIGEVIGAQLPPPPKHVLLVKPEAPCPTGEVFSHVNKTNPEHHLASRNDLEQAACNVCPDIREILAYLRNNLDPKAQMTGSGSTCFALLPLGETLAAKHRTALCTHWLHLTEFQHV